MRLQIIVTSLALILGGTAVAEAADQKVKRSKSQRTVVVQEQVSPSPFGFIGRVIILPFDIAQTVVGHAVAIPVGVLAATRRVVEPEPAPRRR